MVSAAYIDEIAQVNRSAGRRRGHNDVADRFGILELP
jgi:hypothetical protein